MIEHEFDYEADGKTYACSYTVTGGKHKLVEVTTPWGSKTTQVGGSPASVMAKMMARELYESHLATN